MIGTYNSDGVVHPPALVLSYTPGYNQCVKDLPRGCHQEFKLYTVHWITTHKSKSFNDDVEAIDVYDSVYNSIDNARRSVFQNVTTLK